MEIREAFQLLTLASARDGRTVDAAVAAVWADDLADVSLDDAVAAAKAHYQASTAWLMPAHVIEHVAQQKRQQFGAVTMSPEAPKSCPGGEHRMLPNGRCMLCTWRPDDAA
mgnify:CR=1 FL=1